MIGNRQRRITSQSQIVRNRRVVRPKAVVRWLPRISFDFRDFFRGNGRMDMGTGLQRMVRRDQRQEGFGRQPLSTRQAQVAAMRCRDGKTCEEIAGELGLCTKWVQDISHEVMVRLGVRTIGQACYQLGRGVMEAEIAHNAESRKRKGI